MRREWQPSMPGASLNYSVLVYEDEYGLWLKIPEFDLQISTEDVDVGVDLLEEHLDYLLAECKGRGEPVPEQHVRTIRWVGKEEYGPTEVELQEISRREEFSEGSDE